ncbi:uncharacterized protein LOC120771963 [Bactrocera tryoni]|uniref:uncharacterized protein LOC120771963 n=1 Tax=Bactrocera tryoni TaxID=59916 RepID=UPI001A96D221|nr:uncharacterized protein LOC120771963 [Bactrocera tryoni]
MYNVTPHGTTGKSKIPSLQDVEEPFLDLEARDLDYGNKEKGKKRGNEDRRAKESEIAVGDKVLVRNTILPNKLSTTFNAEEFEVIKRTGNDVVVRGNGKELRRNVSHLKKLPVPEVTEGDKDTAKQDTNPPLKLTLENIGGMWRSGSARDLGAPGDSERNENGAVREVCFGSVK